MNQQAQLFKVGDIVRIKKIKPANRAYHSPSNNCKDMTFAEKMVEFCGKQARIVSVYEHRYGYTYSLDIDYREWTWTNEFLEPIIKTNRDAISLLKKE